MEPFPICEILTTQLVSNLQVWATVIGSHLKEEPTASPVLTKWWKLELTLATNFGNHAQMVTKFGGQILATKFGSVPDCLLGMISCEVKGLATHATNLWRLKNFQLCDDICTYTQFDVLVQERHCSYVFLAITNRVAFNKNSPDKFSWKYWQ